MRLHFSFLLSLAANQAEAIVPEILPLRYPFAAVQAAQLMQPRQAHTHLQGMPTQLLSTVQPDCRGQVCPSPTKPSTSLTVTHHIFNSRNPRQKYESNLISGRRNWISLTQKPCNAVDSYFLQSTALCSVVSDALPNTAGNEKQPPNCLAFLSGWGCAVV